HTGKSLLRCAVRSKTESCSCKAGLRITRRINSSIRLKCCQRHVTVRTPLRADQESTLTSTPTDMRRYARLWRADQESTLTSTPEACVPYFPHCPIFSVPNVPRPFRRKAKTKRFSLRRPTLKLNACAVIMQHFHVYPSVAVELIKARLLPANGCF